MLEKDFIKMWSEKGYIIATGAPAENGHEVIMTASDDDIFRFRSSFIFEKKDYGEDSLHLISGDLKQTFRLLYGADDFIPSIFDKLPERMPLEGENKVYMAVSKKDRDTSGRYVPRWVISVTAGKYRQESCLPNLRSEDNVQYDAQHDEPENGKETVLHDNTGDNISDRNCLYSEASVMYWLWKNTGEMDNIGLFQYRRFFASDAACMSQFDDYDMITTIPSFVPATIKSFFTRTMVIDMDWQLMMLAIEQDCKDYYSDALLYEKSHFYFPCNLFYMKRKLFDEMCSFIFKVTFDIEEFYGRCNVKRGERYLGYIVENLVSIFICHNRDRIRKACVDMKFYPAEPDGEDILM